MVVVKCNRCNGRGKLIWTDPVAGKTTTINCPDCNGSGKIIV